MEGWFNSIVFSYEESDITVAGILISALLSLLLAGTILLFNYWFFNKIRTNDRKKNESHKIKPQSYLLIFWGVIFITSKILGLDYEIALFDTEHSISVRSVIQILLLITLASYLDFVLSRLFVQNFYIKTEKEGRDHDNYTGKNAGSQASKLIKRIVYLSVLLYLINTFELNYVIFSYKTFVIDIIGIIVAIVSILAVRLLLWLIIHIVMYNYYRQKEIDIGTQFAINQIIKYVLYVLSIVVIIDIFGENLTVIWGGLAALLVGVGLGLQQTFNDFFSGFVLLFERSVVVGNIVEVDGKIGRVKQIGLRTSTLQSRDGINLIVPNSKITNDNVINWDYDEHKARFTVSVRVAHGSDTLLVKNLLLQAAAGHPDVLDFPKPLVRLEDFGESALNFSLIFWSTNLFFIENVRSDIRFSIDHMFRANNITIPFPQRDIWVKNAGEAKGL